MKGSNNMSKVITLIAVADAKRYIESHYHTVHLTPEGLLVMGEVVIADKVTRYPDDQDDNWYEEPMVFPIWAGDKVALGDVKAWLGY